MNAGERTMHAVLRQATEDETRQAAAKRTAEDCNSFHQREKLSREQIALIRDQGDHLSPLVESFPQTPGEVYVGNPISYVHGVEYPQCDEEHRIVAVQIRLFMTFEQLFHEHTEWGAENIAAAIATIPLRMPTYDEVVATAQQLQE